MSTDPAAQDPNEAAAGTPPRPWSVFAYRDFSMLWLTGVAMLVTTQLRVLVSYQWLYDKTGSAAELGLLGLVQLAQMPVVLYGGGLADNVDRKKLMAGTQAVVFLMLLGLTLASATGGLQPWHIFAVTGLAGIVNMLSGPARFAMVSRVVPRTHITHAVTINTGTNQAAGVLAPLLFGGVFGVFGPTPAFAVTAGAALLSIVTPLLIRARGKPEGGTRRTSLHSLAEGWRFVLSHRILPGLYMLDIGVTVVSFYRTLFPIFASQLYGMGAVAVGALNAANSVGGIVGTSAVLATSRVRAKGLIVLGASSIYAVMLFAFGFNHIFALGLVIVAVLGATDAVSMVMRQTIVQLTTPDRLLGRASSAHSFAAMGANNLGQLEVGSVSAAIGAGNTMVLGGVVSVIVVAMIYQLVPGVRRYRYDEKNPYHQV